MRLTVRKGDENCKQVLFESLSSWVGSPFEMSITVIDATIMMLSIFDFLFTKQPNETTNCGVCSRRHQQLHYLIFH